MQTCLVPGLGLCFPAWSFTQNLCAFQSLFGFFALLWELCEGSCQSALPRPDSYGKLYFWVWLWTNIGFPNLLVLLATNFPCCMNLSRLWRLVRSYSSAQWVIVFFCYCLDSMPGLSGHRLFFLVVDNILCYCYRAKVALNFGSCVHRFQHNDSLGYSFR